MPFCMNCGNMLNETDAFCGRCGAKQAVIEQQSPMAQFNAQAVSAPDNFGQQPMYQQPPMAQGTLPLDPHFARIPLRYRCANGHVFNSGNILPSCPTCGAPLDNCGIIQLYRMGNFMGCAVGMGIYIDNIPMGHIANKESLRIVVPYGQHKIHVTHTTTRTCNDPIVLITPENPIVYCKAHLASAGFTITVELAAPSAMPMQ